mgnify:FL=1
MASLVPATGKAYLTGALKDHFDTFKETFTIFKEPTRTPTSDTTTKLSYYGYTKRQKEVHFTNTHVSGVYEGIVTYRGNQSADMVSEGDVRHRFSDGDAEIKVESDARKFIKQNGKTLKLTFDESTFNIVGDERVQNYLGLKFYIFPLKHSK